MIEPPVPGDQTNFVAIESRKQPLPERVELNVKNNRISGFPVCIRSNNWSVECFYGSLEFLPSSFGLLGTSIQKNKYADEERKKITCVSNFCF